MVISYLFFWCLPQNFLGFFIYLYSVFRGHCKRIKTSEGFVYFETDKKSKVYGVSLGYFVFLSEYYKDNLLSYHHEFGHQIQSLIYGIFYLFLIGLPSGLSNVFKTAKTSLIYYNYPWERQADKLGGIQHQNLNYTRELLN